MEGWKGSEWRGYVDGMKKNVPYNGLADTSVGCLVVNVDDCLHIRKGAGIFEFPLYIGISGCLISFYLLRRIGPWNQTAIAGRESFSRPKPLLYCTHFIKCPFTEVAFRNRGFLASSSAMASPVWGCVYAPKLVLKRKYCRVPPSYPWLN